MNPLKRIVPATAVAMALLAVVAVGCSRKGASDALSQVKARGTLRVAVEGVYPPWNYHDDTGALVGFDVELARAIAARLGVEAEFAETAWDGIFAGLDADRWDIVANEVEPNPEREASYDFSAPYAKIRTVVIAREADAASISSPADLKGKTTANSVTSTYTATAREWGANPIPVDTLDETIRLLLDGRIDATLNSNLSFYEYMKHHPESPVRVAFEIPGEQAVAIPFAKRVSTATLRAAVDDAIAALRADGTLTQISEKYFGADITQ